MKENLDYVSRMLGVFLESESAYVSSLALMDAMNASDSDSEGENYLFHLQLLADRHLLENPQGSSDLSSLGIQRGLGGDVYPSDASLRLTSDGHDFAKAMANREVLDRLRSEFKDAPFDVVFEGGKKLLTHFFKKKLDSIIE